MISSRTPEGPLNYCPVCGTHCRIEPALLTRDATCPRCGSLLWFDQVVGTGPRDRLWLLREEQLVGAILKQPERIGPYIQLAFDYMSRGLLDAAEKLLANGLRAAPGDETLHRVYSEVQIARIKRAIDALARRVREDATDDATATKIGQLTRLLDEYEITEYRRRLAISPEDTIIRDRLNESLASWTVTV